MADIRTGRKPFLQLTDVPPIYTGSALRVVRVNAGETALEFAALTTVLSFLDLTDTPNSYVGQANNRVTVNPGETGLQFVADTFLEEQDTPNSYVGQSLRVVRVNVGETGLEFAALTTVLSFLDLTDTPNSYAGFANYRVTVNPGETALQFVADTFLEEQDTPNSYAGQAGNFVNVNPGETALQFVTIASLAGTIEPLLTPEITNRGKQWIQHGDNVITLRNEQLDNNYRTKATIFLPLGAIDNLNPITYRGISHAGSTKANSMAIVLRPDTTTTLKVRLEGGFGFVGLGFIAAVSGTAQRFDDVINSQTAIATAWTARQLPSAYSLNGYGFTSGGRTAVSSVGTTERTDDITTDSVTIRATIVARDALSAFTINGYGFTTVGWDTVSGANLNIVERFNDITNTQAGRTGEITSLNSGGAFGLNNFGFVFGGSSANPLDAVAATTTQKFDDVSNTWTARTSLSLGRQVPTGYSLDGYGFASGGATAAGVQFGSTERFDDTANLWTARTNLTTSRSGLAGYSLNGYGFTTTGNSATFAAPANSGVTERYDNVTNTHNTRAVATAKRYATGFATNEYFVEYNTENVSEFDEILNLGTVWIAHGDNVITLPNRHSNLDFRSDIVLQLPIGSTSGADDITYRGPAHSRPMTITSRPDDPYIGFGFTSGGFVAAVSNVTQQYDDPTQVTTVKATLTQARQGLTGYSMNGYGFTSGGTTGAVTGDTDRLDPVANIQNDRTFITARRHLASFVITEGIGNNLRSFAHTIGGFIAAVTATHEEFDDIANTQTARATAGFTAVDKLAGFSINQYGFGLGGTNNDGVAGRSNLNTRYDHISDTWSARTNLIAARMEMGAFAFGGLGYISGGTFDTAVMLATTDRFDDVANAWTNVGNMNTARDLLADWAIKGFGFSACGKTGTDAAPANSNVTERYDPSTTVWTARTPAPVFTARRDLAGYANPTRDNTNATRLLVRLHGGFGFVTGGIDNAAVTVGDITRYDDVTGIHLARTPLIAAVSRHACYSLNGLGFTSCGIGLAGTTGNIERFDDVTNFTPTARTAGTPKYETTGYSLNGFGYATCGIDAGGVDTGDTERFNDLTDTQTTMTAATARAGPMGYSLNGFGFVSCGVIAGFASGDTQRFDDIGNFHTARAPASNKWTGTGYSLNGYGFTSCGFIAAPTAITERLDDVANVQGSRADVNTARYALAGYSLNGFGFTSGGITGINAVSTERFDDMANIQQVVSPLPNALRGLRGYANNEYFVNYSTMD
jgi:hypothetical protein